jgi:putative FmdB family regulatory protein
MPTYEYACKKCGERIEIFQSFSDRPLKRHKTCGGDLKKVFHARGIVFKGDGFYATDSKAASSAKSAPDSTSDKTEKKSEKKPEKSTAKASSNSSTSSDD